MAFFIRNHLRVIRNYSEFSKSCINTSSNPHGRFIAAFFILRENTDEKKTEVMELANYPQYNYQPQPMGYQPQMQPMYQQYQPPMQMPQGQPDQLYCRPVASEEEARGVPVDFSGKPMVFPHLSAGRVYVKAFDQGSGSAVFRRFRMEEETKPEAQETQMQTAVMYAPMGVVEQVRQLEATVAALQEELRVIKRRRAQATEVVADES